MQAYLKPEIALKPARAVDPAPQPDTVDAPGLDRTAKMYVGGKQARPDGGYSQPVYTRRGKLLGHAGIGNRKDIRNAVEAARGATGWSKATGHLRAQILYYIAENLSARADEFATRIRDLTSVSAGKAEAEVAASVDRLFHLRGMGRQVRRRGEIGADPGRRARHAGTAGRDRPSGPRMMRHSLAPCPLLAPAIAMGNRVVLVPSWPAPLAATDLYQVLDTSDVPGGVVNIVTGDPGELGGTLASHLDVDALWSFFAAGGPRRDRGRLGGQSQARLDEPRRQPGLGVSGGRRSTVPRSRDRGQDDLGALRRVRAGVFLAENERKNSSLSTRKTRVFPPRYRRPAAQSFILAQRTATLSTKGSMTRSSNRSQIRQAMKMTSTIPRRITILIQGNDVTSGPETGVMATALG